MSLFRQRSEMGFMVGVLLFACIAALWAFIKIHWIHIIAGTILPIPAFWIYRYYRHSFTDSQLMWSRDILGAVTVVVFIAGIVSYKKNELYLQKNLLNGHVVSKMTEVESDEGFLHEERTYYFELSNPSDSWKKSLIGFYATWYLCLIAPFITMRLIVAFLPEKLTAKT